MELVVAGPDLGITDLLCVVLDDVGEAGRRQCLLPEMIGFQPVWVDWVAGTVVVSALVEGQKDGGFAGKFGAELCFLLVDGEMDGAAAHLEQVLTGVAALPVLLDRIADGLFGEVVLEFKGGDWEAVDEQSQVECALLLVVAVPQLPRYGEAVLGVSFLGRGVPRRGRAVEEVDRAVLVVADASAENVDNAAAAHFTLHAG